MSTKAKNIAAMAILAVMTGLLLLAVWPQDHRPLPPVDHCATYSRALDQYAQDLANAVPETTKAPLSATGAHLGTDFRATQAPEGYTTAEVEAIHHNELSYLKGLCDQSKP